MGITVCEAGNVYVDNRGDLQNVSAHGGGFTMMTTDNGVQFGWGRSGGMFIYMRDGDLFRPIAGDAGQGQFWSDQDEDGFIDPDEVYKRGGLGALLQIDSDLNLWFSCGRRLEPSEVVDGQPMYDPADAVDTPLRGEFTGWRSHYGWNILDREGNAYSSHVTGQGSTGPGLTMKSPDGEIVWQYPDMVGWRDAIELPTGAPGRLWGATQLLGLDTMQDLPGGTYVHTEEDLQRAKEAYHEYLAELEGIQTVKIARGGRDALEDAERVGRRIEGNRICGWRGRRSRPIQWR